MLVHLPLLDQRLRFLLPEGLTELVWNPGTSLDLTGASVSPILKGCVGIEFFTMVVVSTGSKVLSVVPRLKSGLGVVEEWRNTPNIMLDVLVGRYVYLD